MWIDAADYATENTDGTSCDYTSCNDEGPMTVLVALERATKGWTNVNDQTYTMGTTVLYQNKYTQCEYNTNVGFVCTLGGYTLPSRTSKARMITVQEVNKLGCTTTTQSCPNWMNNYLYSSTSYGETVNDNTQYPATTYQNYGYWTMNGDTSYDKRAWNVRYTGYVDNIGTYAANIGARAVVIISK